MLVERCLLLMGGGWVGRWMEKSEYASGWTVFNGTFSEQLA